MTRKYASSLLAGITVGTLLFLSAGCNFSHGPSPQGRLVGRTNCKGSLQANSQGTIRTTNQECVEYVYDGRSVLRLKHVNAGFNCCPGTITADILTLGDEIRIKEKESSSLCDCNCLYDIDYEFVYVSPGIYRISVVGPYQIEGDPPLEFLVDLDGAASGSFCVERTHYPWSI
jgi:hypothetical protein